MPQPSRLLDRIARTPQCGGCRGTNDWVVDGTGGMKRCSCRRGWLLQKADRIREGRQDVEKELEPK